MAASWLCHRKTSTLSAVLVLMVLALLQVTAATAATDTAPRIDGQPANTLSDDIEREEFIDADSQQSHSRQKRLIWLTDDGRLALPPGTTLTFTPTIALPLVRHPPEGFFSNMSISFPVTIDFDKLGLTDNQNPLGDLPPLFARSFGHSAGELLGSYVSQYLHYKTKRDLDAANGAAAGRPSASHSSNFHVKHEKAGVPADELPQLPDRFKHVFHGGERVMLYGVVEDFLSTFGMNGKACLLRTICEIHSRNLKHFGVFGEMTKLFLTVTRSPFSDLIPEYVRAQEIGEGRQAPGECFPYYKECPKSVFKALQNHNYREQQKHEYHEQDAEVVLRQKLPYSSNEGNDLRTNQIDGGSQDSHFIM